MLRNLVLRLLRLDELVEEIHNRKGNYTKEMGQIQIRTRHIKKEANKILDATQRIAVATGAERRGYE